MIRAISACGKFERFDCVHQMKFLDVDGNQLHHYNPSNSSYTYSITQQLASNEQLIGVYGAMNNDDGKIPFKNFGFIVKVKRYS